MVSPVGLARKRVLVALTEPTYYPQADHGKFVNFK